MQLTQKPKQAQKRSRGDKNIKRLQINRRGRPEISPTTPSVFFYLRIIFIWFLMVALDTITGFRFELLWPAWLMIRAAVESIQMRNQHCVTTISNPSAARFSILFVCVTATSDLICYLFIPIRMLIFLATTFVWINLYYHTQGGFLRTMATVYGGERLQSWPIVFITCFIVTFELFLRIRITKFDYIFLFRSHPVLISFFPSAFAVTDWTGVSPVWPRSLNAFFGAHSLGYPAILITVSLHYYLNEWKLRRKQCDVSNRNEQLFRILVESLPAEYEGPKDYTSQQCLEDGNDLYYLDPPVQTTQPMQAIQAAPTVNATPPATSKKNGIHKRNGEVQSSSSKKKKNGNAYNSTPPNDKKKSKSLRDADLDDVDDSDADDYSWRDQSGSEDQRKGGGISIIRIVFGTAWWMVSALFLGSSSSENSSTNRLEDDEEDEENEVEKKNGRTDSLTNSTTTPPTTKARANTLPTTTRSHVNNNNNHSQKQQQHHKQSNGKSHHNHHQKSNGNANGHARSSAAVRDSSHDTNASNDNDIRSMTRELESLRTEISSQRILEEDYKLQISILETNVTSYTQSLQNTKTKIEQMEKKYSILERHRESDKQQLEQSEKKYADLLGKKVEIEATLSAERKARMESTSKKYDVAEHQRERERQLESEIDKLRSELKSKEEANMRMESELHGLRNYKEENDIEALHMELRLARDKSSQMEESLAGENKLKQSLFKCLGEARDRIKSLEHENKEIKTKNGSVSGSSETLMNGRSSTEANNENDTLQTASDQSSPHQHSAMGSPIPFAKMPLTVNVSNRHGSPFSEKLSPIASIGSLLTGVSQAPPDYMMTVNAPVAAQKQQQAAAFAGIRYNEFTHMPTGGEHRLFDTPNSVASVSSQNGTNPEDDFLMNKGKFGAPAQPTARLA